MRPDPVSAARLAVLIAVPPSGLWRAWTFDPAVVAALVLTGALYLRGWSVLRGYRRPPVVARQAVSFSCGLLLLGVALVSPLDALSGTLLSAHMVQHLILMLLAPPLLVYGRPGLVVWMGLPRTVREGASRRSPALSPIARWFTRPLVAFGLYTVFLYGWHAPTLYDAALANPTIHAAEHLCFLAVSLLVWRLVIDPAPRRRCPYPAAMVLTFGVLLVSAALGALIALSPTLIYPAYRTTAPLWGLRPITDQQLAGAIMWVPPGGVYLVTIVTLAARWFAQVERHMRRREGLPAAGRPEPAP